MVSNILEDIGFKDLISSQVKSTLEFLLQKDQEFSVTVNIQATTFDPELPKAIKDQLQNFSLFTLTNYTYTTIKVTDEFMSFEAGFGAENFGSVVKVPLHSVFQIVIDESILFLNPVATVDKFNKANTDEDKRDSMSVFKSNPNNKKFK